MRQQSLKVVASFFCALIKLWCHIFKASYDQQGGDIHRTEGINAYGECNILFVKLWMNSENDKNGNFNQNGVMNRESMATVLVNAYKLEWNENSKLPKEFADLKNHWARSMPIF